MQENMTKVTTGESTIAPCLYFAYAEGKDTPRRVHSLTEPHKEFEQYRTSRALTIRLKGIVS